jgi:hypothetical protein
MRKLMSAMAALVCVVVLSSCSLVPFGHGSGVFDGDLAKADARMKQIGAAINSHDAAALKAVFSKRAIEKAIALDARLDQLLSMFPDGVTWERSSINAKGGIDGQKKTLIMQAHFLVSAGGKDYLLFFADFTENEIDPDNVGVYGLGVTPDTGNQDAGTEEPFYWWTGAIQYDESDPDGYPGVFVGYDNSRLSVHMSEQIVGELNTQDSVGLRNKFSEYARTQHAAEIGDDLDTLVALFAGGEAVWVEEQQEAPVVRDETDATGGTTTLLLTTVRVTSGGQDSRVVFAYFPENAVDPTNIGIYAIGVAPWTDSGDSTAEKALTSWADKFDVDASVPPGIFIAK